MRALISALLVSAAVLILVYAPARAASIAVSPPAGDQDATFTIAVEGLTPGLTLDIAFRSPNGELISAATPKPVLVADGDGDFSFEITPAKDLARIAAGSWLVQICATGTDECVQADFDIEVLPDPD